MIERTEYLEAIKSWREEQVIKVVTGIRRCGKSTLLRQYSNFLISTGVSPEQIVFINFEELEYEDLLDYHKLYAYIKERLVPDRYTYIFLDEIQKVDSFEKVVDSLYVKEKTDIYITGSNAYMLSGELATMLSGRYVEISILPFSFAEYASLHSGDPDKVFAEYLHTGGFPYIVQMDSTKEKAEIYLEGIYNTIIVKDIEERQKRRESDPNKRKVNDLSLLKNISKFLSGSVGSPVSVKSISDYITSSGRRVSANTVNDYVDALVEAFIFYPVERYDIVGKQTLKRDQKLYIVDLGIRNHLLPRRNYDLGFSLENIVYLELLRRGFKVNIGKVGTTEVDFIAEKDSRLQYYQVTASLTDEKTFEREITPLKNIKDNYAKTILTLDRFTFGDYEGIEVVNAVDWLLENR
ncbi:MAG: ATP-binding protein [Ruminococcus sp.]|uniref:ATP-binding protein n=1 Tax=Ruminococcus sp. TaxID=41978 RepID=UPI0025EDE806|nr:ATP-binding protein [Ruminococcus sp.]MCR5541233.1 ATP-binding protein [Ruminococcus sp.]